MKVFLIGFMGCGKTTIGKKLAASLDFKFQDLDELIETKEEQSIADTFEFDGEDQFRKLERLYLRSLKPMKNTVISLGGGAPCFHSNMEWMLEQGVVVYLSMPAKALASRLIENRGERPLLMEMSDDELTEYVTETLESRSEYYDKAHIEIAGLSVNSAAMEDLKKQIKNYRK